MIIVSPSNKRQLRQLRAQQRQLTTQLAPSPAADVQPQLPLEEVPPPMEISAVVLCTTPESDPLPTVSQDDEDWRSSLAILSLDEANSAPLTAIALAFKSALESTGK